MGLVHHPNVVTDGLIGCWDAGNRRSYPTTGTTWTDLADGNNSTLVNGGSGLTFDSANCGSIVFDGTMITLQPLISIMLAQCQEPTPLLLICGFI